MLLLPMLEHLWLMEELRDEGPVDFCPKLLLLEDNLRCIEKLNLYFCTVSECLIQRSLVCF